MARFAVINSDTNIISNIILADDLATAEQATGSTCIESTPEYPVEIGYVLVDGVWKDPNTQVE